IRYGKLPVSGTPEEMLPASSLPLQEHSPSCASKENKLGPCGVRKVQKKRIRSPRLHERSDPARNWVTPLSWVSCHPLVPHDRQVHYFLTNPQVATTTTPLW